MKIVELKPSKRVKGRFLVKLDDDTLLRVSEQEMIDFSLYQGKEISVEEAEALEKSGQTSALKNKALNLLTRKPVSRRDMEKKILEWEGTEEEVLEICDRLEELGLLNDENYARLLCEHYQRKGYGLGRIKQEFYRHGISRDLWDEALEQLEEEGNEVSIDKYIQQKLKGENPDVKMAKKVTDALARRGFSWEEIRSGMIRYNESYAEEWGLD